MYVLDKTTLPEAERHVMEKKTILILGEEQVEYKATRTTIKNYGIKLILVDTKPNPYSADDIYRYIQFDFSDHRQDETHAEQIIQTLATENLSIDGCCTFTDACGPLTASLCEKLLLSGGAGIAGARRVRNKSLTHKHLRKQVNGVYLHPRSHKYAGRSVKINCEETLKSAIKSLGLPVIYKPENGQNANGVMLIRNIEECGQLSKKLNTLLKMGNSMVMMEFFDGTEHDIEVIIYQGEVLAAFVSYNGPTGPESFLETSMSLPSCLPLNKRAPLTEAASACCIDVGLRNGVFNVEMKMTSSGPKLLKINGQICGDYFQTWMYTCYGFNLKLVCYDNSCRNSTVNSERRSIRSRDGGHVCYTDASTHSK